MLTGALWAVKLASEMVVWNRRALHINFILFWLVFFLILFLKSHFEILFNQILSFFVKLNLGFNFERFEIEPILILSYLKKLSQISIDQFIEVEFENLINLLNSLVIYLGHMSHPRLHFENVVVQLTISTYLLVMPLDSTGLTSLEIPFAAKWIMIVLLILTNMAAEFLLDLQRAVNIKMTTLAAFSAFESFVFFLLTIKDYRCLSSIKERVIV